MENVAYFSNQKTNIALRVCFVIRSRAFRRFFCFGHVMARSGPLRCPTPRCPLEVVLVFLIMPRSSLIFPWFCVILNRASSVSPRLSALALSLFQPIIEIMNKFHAEECEEQRFPEFRLFGMRVIELTGLRRYFRYVTLVLFTGFFFRGEFELRAKIFDLKFFCPSKHLDFSVGYISLL